MYILFIYIYAQIGNKISIYLSMSYEIGHIQYQEIIITHASIVLM